jgi:mannose-6-phosphate isomerase-like protein (cupin superfamily)
MGDLSFLTRNKFPVPEDRAAVARDWAERGYSCDEFRDPPGREWNDFVHDTNELVTVIEGRLRVEMDGQSGVLGPGDELFIPKRVRHSVKNVHADVTRWLYGYD